MFDKFLETTCLNQGRIIVSGVNGSVSFTKLFTSSNIPMHTITVLSHWFRTCGQFMHGLRWFRRYVSVQIYKKCKRNRDQMPGARAALEFECLATNDSISGFTISGFSSCKILHKYNKKNKKKNRGLLHWRERGETWGQWPASGRTTNSSTASKSP